MTVGVLFLIAVGAIALFVVGGSVIGYRVADEPGLGALLGVLVFVLLLLLSPLVAHLASIWNNPV